MLPAAENGPAPAPARELPRRILVLHGWDEKIAERMANWPTDTSTAKFLQTPLEWLGYETEFFDIGKQPLPAEPEVRWRAVIVDEDISVPNAREMDFARWLAKCKQRGLRILFLGAIPFSQKDTIDFLNSEFEIGGDGAPQRRMKELRADVAGDPIMQGETSVVPLGGGFSNLQAPRSARVLVSLRGKTETGREVRYDPVFLASWGGAWLDPCLARSANSIQSQFYADPYKFLSAWLGDRAAFPVPDTSTRDGRRIFYSHIDGDGFPTPADFRGHPVCAEIVRDRILKVFPFPITVSVIEADIRALVKGLDDASAARYADIARSIFALPNVRVASHSFSHPYVWEKRDPNPGTYDKPNMVLKESANYPEINLATEIRGSVEFINRELAPRDKQVELFFWPGNCRPGPDALRMVRDLGIENMNGGNTVRSHLYPGLSAIAPRVTFWDGEMQIHASNQNEFMYANGFGGPFFNGFQTLIETLEQTGTPRRIKPVNVYYHFYSAQRLGSLRSLEKIYRWCDGQKLHSITARTFADLTRDSYQTRILQTGAHRWLAVNEGHQRTFRLPQTAGVPDIAQCRGVTGWVREGDQIYLHTSGSKQTEIVLAAPGEKPTPHAWLAESSAEIRFREFSPQKFEFDAEDFRAVETVFAGLPANAACEVTVNESTSRLKADASGTLTLSLPARCHVILDATHARYATR